MCVNSRRHLEVNSGLRTRPNLGGELESVCDRGKIGKDFECVGEKKLFLYPLRFSSWGVCIKLTKDGLIEEKAYHFY